MSNLNRIHYFLLIIYLTTVDLTPLQSIVNQNSSFTLQIDIQPNSSKTSNRNHANMGKQILSTVSVNKELQTTSYKAITNHANIDVTEGHGTHLDSSNVHGTNSNETDHHTNQGHGGNEHGSNSGGHHVPPPSYQLQLHMYSYKPEGFSLFQREAGLQKILVGFNYDIVSHYDRYVIRVRYHGHEEYSTNKMKINRTEPNQLLLKNFLDAQYIVCVTLFSSSGLTEYPPLSTSDMCIDVSAGEPVPIGGHHSTTGLLSPLLLAVAAILLFIIAVGTRIKESYLERAKKGKLRTKRREKMINLHREKIQ